MASKEVQDQVKKKLFEDWMPDKPGGLKGLVNMAADAALAVIAERAVVVEQKMRERVEFLEGELALALHFDELEPDTDLEPSPPPIDITGPMMEVSLEPEVDQTQYRCPQCDVTHRRDSDVGTRHAHLFYGGTPAVVHLELCPVLEDSEATCNCNAVPASADQRAADRRPHDRF